MPRGGTFVPESRPFSAALASPDRLATVRRLADASDRTRRLVEPLLGPVARILALPSLSLVLVDEGRVETLAAWPPAAPSAPAAACIGVVSRGAAVFLSDVQSTRPDGVPWPPSVGAFAGIPVRTAPNRAWVACLAAVAEVPRRWHAESRHALTGLAACAGAALDAVLAAPDAGLPGAGLDVSDPHELAAEQAALRRVAETVARASGPEEVFETVAEEVQRLLGVPSDAIARMHDDGSHEVVAACGLDPEDANALCQGMWQDGKGPAATAWMAGQPFGFADSLTSHVAAVRAYAEVGVRSYASAPVFAGGKFWGAVALGSPQPDALDDHGLERLQRLAELVSVALDNAEQRRLLAEQATTDGLTGLANHRVFHEELAREIARARRSGEPLAIALLDVDHFKDINDGLGHQAGDEMLRAVARCLREASREGEVVARLGGDEFGTVLPRTDGAGAESLARRVRAALSATNPLPGHPVTVSVGVCDLDHARDADELVRFADGALYWVKAHGRDAVCRYTPEVVVVLSAGERAERLARSQAMAALRSLARALDVRDPSTHRHSERVAELADQLATSAGWAENARVRLRSAALLHDVGKIAVPDRILHKAGPLNAEEYEAIKEHAEIGARIASEALDPEQVGWIRHHHERWDGRGYPDALAGDAIPEGARILAVADAYDVMTHSRHYREPLDRGPALRECRRHAGAQFCPGLVEHLSDVVGPWTALTPDGPVAAP
jgi:diguanylate cyclase (GGDEF)-like protein